jgi:hypothetical protein
VRSIERSLETVRRMAGLGDCTKFGAVNLGIAEVDGAGVGSGGKEGLLGAVSVSSVGGSKVDEGRAGPLSWVCGGDDFDPSWSSSEADSVRKLLGEAVKTATTLRS